MALNDHFLWGSATASYQCEGAWDLDDKAESNWDRYLHENELENGDVPLDDAIDEFNNAMQLVKICENKLSAAEESIAKIVQDNGQIEDFKISE